MSLSDMKNEAILTVDSMIVDNQNQSSLQKEALGLAYGPKSQINLSPSGDAQVTNTLPNGQTQTEDINTTLSFTLLPLGAKFNSTVTNAQKQVVEKVSGSLSMDGLGFTLNTPTTTNATVSDANGVVQRKLVAKTDGKGHITETVTDAQGREVVTGQTNSNYLNGNPDYTASTVFTNGASKLGTISSSYHSTANSLTETRTESGGWM